MSGVQPSSELAAQTLWPVDRIKDHALKIGSGVTPPGGAASYLDAGIPLLRSQNVHFDILRFDDVAYIAEETQEEMSGTKLRARDVLLNITGLDTSVSWKPEGCRGEPVPCISAGAPDNSRDEGDDLHPAPALRSFVLVRNRLWTLKPA
jgi:hypothetical protein